MSELPRQSAFAVALERAQARIDAQPPGQGNGALVAALFPGVDPRDVYVQAVHVLNDVAPRHQENAPNGNWIPAAAADLFAVGLIVGRELADAE